MYTSSAIHRSPVEEEERIGREKRANPSVQQLPPYSARSPTMGQFGEYSPKNGANPQSSYNSYSSRPSSSAAPQIGPALNRSPRLGPVASPTNGVSRASYSARETSKTTYYDPTSEHRDTGNNWSHSPYAGRSPIQVKKKLPSAMFP